MIKKRKLIFMGTPQFSVPILKALCDAGHNVVAVYSQPPKPVGRGYAVTKSPVHAFAEARGITVRTPSSLKDEAELAFFKAQNVDAVVVVAYGLLLPKDYLEAHPYGCLNIHTSLLPRWRGSSPIHRALLAGDDQTGVTIMKMDEGMDTGPMLLQETMPIKSQDTLETLHDALSVLGAKLMLQALENLENLTPTPQPVEGVTHAPKITKEDGRLDFNQSAEVLARKVKALNPWPGTFFEAKGEAIKVLKAEAFDLNHQKAPGTVLDENLTIACAKGALKLLVLQRPGKKALEASEFIKGFKLMLGESLCPVIN